MILAAVSGGLDSVAMLWRLLTETEQRIHVHHVEIHNRLGRSMLERRAMERIVPWVHREARPFAYTTSVRGFTTIRSVPDIVIATEECAKAALAYPRGEVAGLARGANWHDMRNGGTGRRQRAAQDVWRRFWGSGAPPIVFPIADLTRPQLWGMLPPELARLTWSCRRPMKVVEGRWNPCRACETCKQLAAHGVPLERAYG